MNSAMSEEGHKNKSTKLPLVCMLDLAACLIKLLRMKTPL